MEYDLRSNVKVVNVITPTEGDAAGASTVGAILDMARFESLTYVVASGTITTGTFTVVLEESDEVTFGGEETVVDSELVIGAISFLVTDDDTVQTVGIVGKKQFQRLTLVGASTPVADFAVTAIQGHPQTRPTTQ